MQISKLNKTIQFTIPALIIMLALWLTSCNTKADNSAVNQAAEKSEKERVFPVKVQKIKQETISRTLNYTADLIPFKEIHFAPAAPGRINKIFVEIGNHVSRTQVLAEMDRTQLNQAQTQLANASYNFNQIDTLYQLGSISEQQFEQAKTQYELAKSNVEYLAENTTLLSPINGLVTGKYFEDGELYSSAPNTAAGKAAIVSLMQIDPVKAVVNISQIYFPKIKNGMAATISTDIYPNLTFTGNVYKVHPTINTATRTFQVEILIKNEQETLRPGMFTNVELKLEDAQTLMVPAIAVLKQEGTNNRYIFVKENGIARQVEVQIGKHIDDKLELKTNGVKEGTVLIVEGQANLLNGSKIEVVNR